MYEFGLMEAQEAMRDAIDPAYAQARQEALQAGLEPPAHATLVPKRRLHLRLVGLPHAADGAACLRPAIGDLGTAHMNQLVRGTCAAALASTTCMTIRSSLLIAVQIGGTMRPRRAEPAARKGRGQPAPQRRRFNPCVQVCVAGTVVRTGTVRMCKAATHFECCRCKHRVMVRCRLEEGGVAAAPDACHNPRLPCAGSKFKVVADQDVFTGFQEVKVRTHGGLALCLPGAGHTGLACSLSCPYAGCRCGRRVCRQC